MREIKFRAWDTSRKKMWSAEQMGADELTLNPDGRGFVNVSSASQRLSQYMSHMIPLQFTGLKDRNGREIYEGDIVRTTSIMDEVIFGDVVWDEDGFQYAVDIGCELMEFHNIIHTEKTVEVIGNIYENPELLHDTQS